MTVVEDPCLSDREHPIAHGHADHTTGGPGPATGRMRATAAATGLFGATALTYVVVHDPTNGSLVPACPVRELSGIWCPGCGLTRSVHAFSNGDPVKAFRMNMFMLPIMTALGLLYGSWALRSFGVNVGNPGAWFAKRPRVIVGTIAVMLTFMVVRNLPGLEFLIGQ